MLPLAITVPVAREVLAEAGFDPNLVQLAAEAPGERLATTLALRPEVRIIDFTGSTEFGDWLEDNARQASVYTEKAGVNTIVVDSTDDFAGMCRNLGFSLTLYSGQMCTTPQNILVPAGGIATDQGHKSFDEVAAGIAAAVGKLTADPARAVELTGAIVNDGVLTRLDEVAGGRRRRCWTRARSTHPAFADAVVRTPADRQAGRGRRGDLRPRVVRPDLVRRSPPTRPRTASRSSGTRSAAKGALTAAVYSTDEKVLDAVEQAALDVGVHLSCNLTGGVFVNQSAAFSDFHATGANPAANAALTDGAYVASRFRVVQSRRHI